MHRIFFTSIHVWHFFSSLILYRPFRMYQQNSKIIIGYQPPPSQSVPHACPFQSPAGGVHFSRAVPHACPFQSPAGGVHFSPGGPACMSLPIPGGWGTSLLQGGPACMSLPMPGAWGTSPSPSRMRVPSNPRRCGTSPRVRPACMSLPILGRWGTSPQSVPHACPFQSPAGGCMFSQSWHLLTQWMTIVHEPRSGEPIFLVLFWTPVSDVFLASTNAMETIVHEPRRRADFFWLFLNPRKWCFPGIY